MNLLITVIPFGIFICFQDYLYGNPLAFMTAEKINWSQQTVLPWVGIVNLLGYLNTGVMWQINFIFLLMMIITLVLATKKIKLHYLLFGWGVVLLNISQSFPLSIGRHMMMVIPFYLFWGNYFVKHPIARQLTFAVFSSWMAFNVILFVLSLNLF
jgi:hypothetical protein